MPRRPQRKLRIRRLYCTRVCRWRGFPSPRAGGSPTDRGPTTHRYLAELVPVGMLDPTGCTIRRERIGCRCRIKCHIACWRIGAAPSSSVSGWSLESLVAAGDTHNDTLVTQVLGRKKNNFEKCLASPDRIQRNSTAKQRFPTYGALLVKTGRRRPQRAHRKKIETEGMLIRKPEKKCCLSSIRSAFTGRTWVIHLQAECFQHQPGARSSTVEQV